MAVSKELSSNVRLPVAPSAFLCSLSTYLVRVIVSTSTSSGGKGAAACMVSSTLNNRLYKVSWVEMLLHISVLRGDN